MASRYWSVGDTKKVTLNGTISFYPEYDSNKISYNNLTVEAFIVGINHNASREGNNLIHFQLGKVGNYVRCFQAEYYGVRQTGGFCHADYAGRSKGWSQSLIRNKYLATSDVGNPQVLGGTNTFTSLWPISLINNIRSVTKYTNNNKPASNLSSDITSTTDKLFIMSEYELFGYCYNANKYEQNYQKYYAYYSSGNSRDGNGITYLGELESVNSARYFWTRSPATTQNRFCAWGGSLGDYENLSSIYEGNTSLAVQPCFCV